MTEPIWFQVSHRAPLHMLKRVITCDNVNENRYADGYGSPLLNALINTNVDCVRWLVQEMGADVHDAMRRLKRMPRNADIICILYAAGVDVDYLDSYGDSLLGDMLGHHMGSDMRRPFDMDVIRALISCDASLYLDEEECCPAAYNHYKICVAARAACKQAARTLLYIGRLQPGGRDVCGIIARLVWQSRRMTGWEKK